MELQLTPLRAWARVHRLLPEARLEIYGRGPLLTQLTEQIKQLNLGSSVTLAGFTTDPHGVYRRAGFDELAVQWQLYRNQAASTDSPD